MNALCEAFGIENVENLAHSLHSVHQQLAKPDNRYQLHYCSTQVVFAVLWLIFHEVGHVMCGHLGRLIDNDAAKLGISETTKGVVQNSMYATDNTQKPTEDEWLRVLCEEYMADSYATVRLSLTLNRFFSVEKYPYPDSSNIGFSQKSVLLSSGFITLTLLNGMARVASGQKYLAGNSVIDGGNDLYPTELGRYLATVMAIYFTVYPLTNVNRPSANLLTRGLFLEYTSKNSMEIIAAHISEGIVCTFRNWKTLGLIKDHHLNALINDLPVIWANTAFAPVGGIIFGNLQNIHLADNEAKQIYELIQTETQFTQKFWNKHYSLYDYAHRNLSTQTNGKFIPYLPELSIGSSNMVLPAVEELWESIDEIDKNSFAEFKLQYAYSKQVMEISKYPRDAAYQIMDNWMSQMQFFYSGSRYGVNFEGGDPDFSLRDDIIGSLSFGVKVFRLMKEHQMI